jgi:hypothetical protein
MQNTRNSLQTGSVTGIVAGALHEPESAVFLRDSRPADSGVRRTGLSEPMPNGDPPSVVLWGADEEG